MTSSCSVTLNCNLLVEWTGIDALYLRSLYQDLNLEMDPEGRGLSLAAGGGCVGLTWSRTLLARTMLPLWTRGTTRVLDGFSDSRAYPCWPPCAPERQATRNRSLHQSCCGMLG